MNVITQYFEELFMMLGSQSRRIQHIDNSIQNLSETIKSKSSKKTRLK